MKTVYKFIEFTPGDWDDDNWICINKKHRDKLGIVEYYSTWRRFVFQPASGDTVFSQDCLLDIINFIKQLEYLEKEKAFQVHDEKDRKGETV